MVSERFAPSVINSPVSNKVTHETPMDHYKKSELGAKSSNIYKTEKSQSRNDFELDLIGAIMEQKRQHDLKVKLEKKQEKAEVREQLKQQEKEESIKKQNKYSKMILLKNKLAEQK